MTTQDSKPYPELLTDDERKSLLKDAEWLWEALQKNDLGGYSGGNRPFYILHAFKQVIEKYGHRDVGLNWSKNDLDAHSSQREPKT
jgi:hypothetical protein